VDWAAVNSCMVEEVAINEYSDLLQEDHDALEWDKEDEDYFGLDSDSDIELHHDLLT
jgi:hypothetical protein